MDDGEEAAALGALDDAVVVRARERDRLADAKLRDGPLVRALELGVEKVAVLPADTKVGSAGSTSASRQTYMTGGVVRMACEAVRERVFERVREEFGQEPDGLSLEGGNVVSGSRIVVPLAERSWTSMWSSGSCGWWR